jgi:hypothetical protein
VEDVPHGPVRGDSGLGYQVLHFETILDGPGFPVTYPRDVASNKIPYADSLNDGHGTAAWSSLWQDSTNPIPAPAQSFPQPRDPWFRIDDTIYPPIRWLSNTNPAASPPETAASGSPFDGPLSRQSYVWHVFYNRTTSPPLGSSGFIPDRRQVSDSRLAFFVSVCRLSDGDRFAFQDEASLGSYLPTPANEPTVSTQGLSLLPIPWRVNVSKNGNKLRERAGSGGPADWGTKLNLSQLAPRGAQLLNRVNGEIYTVTRSPSLDVITGDPIPEEIEVAPTPTAADFDVWLFPPPVQTDGNNNVIGFESDSPYVTGLHF